MFFGDMDIEGGIEREDLVKRIGDKGTHIYTQGCCGRPPDEGWGSLKGKGKRCLHRGNNS